MQLEERKLKEIEHSDRRRKIVRAHEYKTDGVLEELDQQHIADPEQYEQHFSNMKFYSVSRSSFAYRDALLFSNIRDAVALDYCCGNGEVAVRMAKSGAKKVCGVDISQVAIDNAKKLAEAEGVADICEFKVMDAEKTEFGDETFDLIHEYGALHHLELNAAFKELSRILRKNGRIICTEAMRHNPVIHWYRKRTPQLRTAWEVEHILGVPEIYQGSAFFDKIDMRMFHLAALAAVPFRKTPLMNPILTILESVDNVLLKIPGVKKMAWVAVITYSGPKSASPYTTES